MYPSFRILILVPDRVLRNQIEQCLQSKHYVIDVATSEKNGLSKFYENAYNLVICQDKLNDTSGFRIFKKLEEAMEKSNTAFFMLLRKYSKEDVQFGLELGIDNFIFTPLEETSLRTRWINCIKNRFVSIITKPRVSGKNFIVRPFPCFFQKISG